MNSYEIGMQLTLKAMELGIIKTDTYSYDDHKVIEEVNAFNAKQISDFYIAMCHAYSN